MKTCFMTEPNQAWHKTVSFVRVCALNCRLAKVVQQATPNCPHAAARMNLKPNKQQIPFKQVGTCQCCFNFMSLINKIILDVDDVDCCNKS